MIKFRKIEKGCYEIISNGQLVGKASNIISDEGHSIWFAESFEMFVGKRVFSESLTRKEAASALIAKMEAAPEIEIQEAVKTLEEEMKEEIQTAVDAKIKVADPESKTSIWIGSPKHELLGSKRLDFLEFMFLYTDGSVVTLTDYDKLCERYAEDDAEDITAASHDQNFTDTWADYLRTWEKVNKDRLCSCCNGSGSVKGSETKTIIKMITCPECKGDGLEIKKVTAADFIKLNDVFKQDQTAAAAPSCDMCGDTGRIADDILCLKCDDHFADEVQECIHCNGKGFNGLDKCTGCNNPEVVISDPGAPEIEDKNEIHFNWVEAVEVHSLQKALFEIKEGGEIKIKDTDSHLIDIVIQELSEMGIPFIKWAYDQEYTGIMQGDEEVIA